MLQYDEKWLDFICKCRIDGQESDYDIIYDKIADNQYTEISDALREYQERANDAVNIIKRISWDNPKADQYCFKTERALILLKNRKMYIQQKDSNGRWLPLAGR